MSSPTVFHSEHGTTITVLIVDHPYYLALLLFVLCCITTRIRTGLLVNYKGQDVIEGKPRDIPIVPYWLPLIGHTFQFMFKFQDYLKALAPRIPSGIFTLKVGGGNHVIVTAPSLVRDIYNKPSLPIDAETISLWFFDIGFGGGNAFKVWNDEKHDDLWATHEIVANLMKEPFLTNAIKSTVTAVEDHTWGLISGLPSWVDHSAWERAGQVEVISTDSGDGNFVAEADLYGLSHHFVGDIATSLLMGQAFLVNNPTFLDDLWLLDSKLHTILFGLPSWLTPGVPPAIGARKRLLDAIGKHHKAMIDIIEGNDPGYEYSELNDVSSLVWDRVRAYHKLKNEERVYAAGDLVLIWAMNANANPVVFWMLYYIYSNPQLLQQIRDELEPFVQLRQTESSGLPIKEAPRLSIDIARIHQKCPLLKGVFLETMRLEVAAIPYRFATEDFVLNESKEDALKAGKEKPDKYLVKKGDILAIPMIVHQNDPAYFKEPTKFDPRRFWVDDTDEKGENQIRVEYGTMRIWGGGAQMCKGRNFAEREILAFVTGIVTLWEMAPATKSGWKHPGNKDTVGTYLPKRDIRVKIWRREM